MKEIKTNVVKKGISIQKHNIQQTICDFSNFFYKVVASKIIGSVPTTKYSVDDVREALKSKEEFASITEKDIVKTFISKIKRFTFSFELMLKSIM